jgi:membrane associated rhomboid family serine protease
LLLPKLLWYIQLQHALHHHLHQIMDLSPSQHRQATAAWSKIRSILDYGPKDAIDSSTNAFIALALLNVPAPAAYHLIKTRATRQALLEWPETFNARWVAHYFPDKQPSLLVDHISSRVRDALQGFTSNLVLSPLTTSRNRWWTIVTANFTHFNLSHFLGNMLALNAVGPACAEVPGMSPMHVFGIALTTSLATGFQSLYRLSDTPNWTMCGFSAVLCAFTSVAALGAPQSKPDMFGKYPIKANSVWTVAGMQILSDVISLVRARSGTSGESRFGKTETVDYVGHLVGYACGAAYYACLLWRESSDDDAVDGEALEHPTGVWDEILRTRNPAAPVKPSEDWKGIADKLGHSTEDSQT